jgi:hypothetical protein
LIVKYSQKLIIKGMSFWILMNNKRVIRLIENAIRINQLKLKGRIILTETGSNNYIFTPIIAAKAGAEEVWAITNDSVYGTASENIRSTSEFAKLLKIEDKIHFTAEKKEEIIRKADIITNLGFVRPIGKKNVNMMSDRSVIPLMYASWEFRDTDLNLEACNIRGIPVMGTDESVGATNIFPFCGALCAKMIFEIGLENDTLSSMGANVKLVKNLGDEVSQLILRTADCLIISDYKNKEIIIGKKGQITAEKLARISPGITVIQFTGVVDINTLIQNKINLYPKEMLSPKRMSKTLAHLGPLPVIELHTAGLKVGQAMFEAKELGFRGEEFLQDVKEKSFAQEVQGANY